MLDVIMSAFGVFAISVIVSEYDGMASILYKLRQIDKTKVLSCGVCLSFWVAIPFCLFLDTGLLGYLASLGGAIFLLRKS